MRGGHIGGQATISVPVMALKSAYFNALDNESKKRYLEKIKEIDEIDPYSLKKKDFSANYEDFPSIGYPDFVNYLLFSPSPVTKEDLKNYKSLESYNHFVCGWVREVLVYARSDMKNIIITGKVSFVIF